MEIASPWTSRKFNIALPKPSLPRGSPLPSSLLTAACWPWRWGSAVGCRDAKEEPTTCLWRACLHHCFVTRAFLPQAELQSAAGMLEAFYPGTYGGQAVAEAIFGVFSPSGTTRLAALLPRCLLRPSCSSMSRFSSGKLPYTMYSADIVDQVSMLDMDLQTPPGRTYRYFTGRPLRPFG